MNRGLFSTPDELAFLAQVNYIAQREGWKLYDNDGLGYLQIQRVDDAEVFDQDADAIDFVIAKASTSAIHRHALTLHTGYAPMIEDHCRAENARLAGEREAERQRREAEADRAFAAAVAKATPDDLARIKAGLRDDDLRALVIAARAVTNAQHFASPEAIKQAMGYLVVALDRFEHWLEAEGAS